MAVADGAEGLRCRRNARGAQRPDLLHKAGFDHRPGAQADAPVELVARAGDHQRQVAVALLLQPMLGVLLAPLAACDLDDLQRADDAHGVAVVHGGRCLRVAFTEPRVEGLDADRLDLRGERGAQFGLRCAAGG